MGVVTVPRRGEELLFLFRVLFFLLIFGILRAEMISKGFHVDTYVP